VIHLAGPLLLPMLIGLLLRKPVAVEHHGFQAICPNGQLLFEPTQGFCPGHFMAGRPGECLRCNSKQGKMRSFRMWLLTYPRRRLCQMIGLNMMPTKWLGQLLNLNRMTTIVHGLPATMIKPTVILPVMIPTFVFIGRLVSTKGVPVLLNAARQLKSSGITFRVEIIGQGPDRESLEAMVQDFQIEDHVRFRGYLAEELVEESTANAVAIVMPSLAGEVFGLSAAENMLRGHLLIVSDIGSLSEVVGDSGMKFAPGDATDLARCMRVVINDPLVRLELGQKASKRISEFYSIDEMIEKHVQCYEDLCRKQSNF
jgi:glycosyltransferase involved in cell wall biosynthesis